MILMIKKIVGLQGPISNFPYSYRWLNKNEIFEYATRNFIPEINIENNDEQTDKRYQFFLLMTKYMMKEIR